MADNYSSLPTLTQRDLQDPTLFRFNSVVSQILNELLALRNTQQQVSAKTAAIESLVAPEGVGRQADTSYIPGDVRPIGGEPFLISQTNLPGGEKAFDIEYDPPDPVGVFAGVYVVVTAPSVGGVDYFPGGDFQYNGDPNAADASRHGTLRVVMPTPAVQETWRFYLVSYATDYRKAFYHFDEVLEVPSPNRTFAVDPAPQPAGDAMPDAETILGATAAVEYGVQESADGTRKLLYHIKGDLDLRRDELGGIADQYYLHTRVFCYDPVVGDANAEEIAWGVESYDGRWYPAVGAIRRLKFVSTNKENKDNAAPYILADPVTIEAFPALPAITGATVELQRQVINQDTGTPKEQWRLVCSFTQATSSYQWYVRAQLVGTAGQDNGKTINLLEVGEPKRAFITDWFDQGARSTYQLQLVPVNRLEEFQLPYDVGAPFTVAPMDNAPAVADPAVSIETADFKTDAGLVRKYRFKGSWTRGAGDQYWFTRITLLPQPAGAAIPIAEEADAFQTDWFDIGAPASYKVRFTPVNRLRAEATAQAAAGDPVFSISGISAAGNVRNCAVVVKTQAVDRPEGRVKQWSVNLKWDLPLDTTDFGWCVPTAVYDNGHEAPFTGHETESPGNIGVPSSWFDLTEEIHFSIEFRTYNVAGDLAAGAPTFPGYVLSPDGVTIPVSMPPAPADVTPGTPEYAHRDDGTTEIRAPYAAPVGDSQFSGVLLEIEAPDQSALPTAQIDGSTLWDGSVALNGDPKPIAQQFPYVAGVAPAITIPSPVYQMNVRVRWRSCSASQTNDTGPSAVITIPPPGVAKPAAGNAVCEMATWGANPASASAPYDISGKLEQDIAFSGIVPPVDMKYSGWEIWSSGWPDDPETWLHTGILTSTGTSVTVSCPKTEISVRFWLRSVSKAADGTIKRNPLVPGVTPSVMVNLGTTTGTINAGEMLAATLAASLRVINKVLGVPDNGITESLIATFAVSEQKLADAAAATAKIKDLSVITQKLADLATDTSKLADLAAVAGKIGEQSVLTGKLADLAATAAKLADGAATDVKIANLAVGTAAMKDLAATSAKLADAAVETAKIKNLAVTNAAIALLAVGSGNMQDASIVNAKIGNLAVAAANIQDASVTTAKIQNLAVTNALIAYLAVGSANIQDLAVNDAKIASCSINKLTAGSIGLSDWLTITNGLKSLKLDTSNWIVMTDAATKWQTQFTNAYLQIRKTDDVTAQVDLYPYYLKVQYTTNVLFGAAAVPWSSGIRSVLDFYNGVTRFMVSLGAAIPNNAATYVAIDGLQVLTTRQAAVASPSGGTVIDTQARTAIDELRNRLQIHGLISI